MTIDKLGVKPYDTVSAVVAELIANGYDADATKVIVGVPLGVTLAKRAGKGTDWHDQGFIIEVGDGGHGMSKEEANEHFLKVGRERRISWPRDLARFSGGTPLLLSRTAISNPSEGVNRRASGERSLRTARDQEETSAAHDRTATSLNPSVATVSPASSDTFTVHATGSGLTSIDVKDTIGNDFLVAVTVP